MAERIGQSTIPYCSPNSGTIFDSLQRIRLPHLRGYTVSTKNIHEIQNRRKATIIFSGSMADRDSVSPVNRTFWNSVTAGFEFFRSRGVEISTATAATTRTSPRPMVPPPGVEFDQASPPDIYAAMLASSFRESAELIKRQNEWRIQNEQRIQNEERIRFNDERFHNSIADYERDVGSESTLAAETPNVTPNAAKYLSELQPIAVKDLPQDSRICAICKEPYNSDKYPEQACKVGPCGHVLGRTCLSTWVMPAGSRPNKTCPLCRAALFEDDTPDPSEDFDDFLLDQDELEEDEELPLDRLAGEDEEPYDDDRMVNGRYASGMLDPAILDVISGIQGQQAWDDLRAQSLERAGAEIAQPPYMLSEYVLFFFRRFVQGGNLGRSVRGSNLERWAAISAGSSVRRIMGQLYVRQREDMERTAMPIVWKENGPPLDLILDPATTPLIETGLERLVDNELQRYAAER